MLLYGLTKIDFSNTILCHTHYSDYETDTENTGKKKMSIIAKDKTFRKRDCINGTFLKGITEPIFLSFAADKSPGFEVFMDQKQNSS